jgi:hypothetical protein
MHTHQPKWLWWLAGFILLLGGAITYLFYAQGTAEARTNMSISLAITVVTAGISIICATADWWMHR